MTPSETSAERGSFFIVLASLGARFEVPPDKSILDVLEENDEDVPFSCREGQCGTCITGVLAGTPDHRDGVLSEDEHAANDMMTVCCSRALSDELVLDL